MRMRPAGSYFSAQWPLPNARRAIPLGDCRPRRAGIPRNLRKWAHFAARLQAPLVRPTTNHSALGARGRLLDHALRSVTSEVRSRDRRAAREMAKFTTQGCDMETITSTTKIRSPSHSQ